MAVRQAEPYSPAFAERAQVAGLTDPGCSWAFTLGDYDQDGDPDLFYTNHVTTWFEDHGQDMRSRLYRNEGGLRFSEVREVGLDERVVDAHHASWLDLEGDGDLDLYVVQGTPKHGKPDHNNRLYLQNDGRFESVPLTGEASGVGWRTRGGAWSDLDRDGDADFVGAGVISTGGRKGSGTFVLDNRGPAGFQPIQAASGLQRADQESFQTSMADIDGDLWPEVLITPRLGLYHNQRDGTFIDEAAARGIDPNLDVSSSTWGDFDNDGDLDLVLSVTNFILVFHLGAKAAPMGLRLYENDGSGHFSDATTRFGAIPSAPYPMALFGDLDNDGDLDLFAPAGRQGQHHLLLLNRGAAGGYTFEEVGEQMGLRAIDNGSHTDASLADLDCDGRLDILIANGRADCREKPPTPPELWHNQGSAGNHIQVRLVSTRSAPDGLGATVVVRSARGEQARAQLGHHHLSQDTLPLHFGLGAASRVDEIEVRWPSGAVDRYPGGRAGQTFTLVEGKGRAMASDYKSPPKTR